VGFFCIICVCQRDKIEEALRLAELSAEKPHFSHCLEWLLFTVFEADISRYFNLETLIVSDIESNMSFNPCLCIWGYFTTSYVSAKYYKGNLSFLLYNLTNSWNMISVGRLLLKLDSYKTYHHEKLGFVLPWYGLKWGHFGKILEEVKGRGIRNMVSKEKWKETITSY
jgi:hypothetical protein